MLFSKKKPMSFVPTSSAQYRLAAHVRACRVEEQVVLLDLRANRYLGVGGPQLSAMARFIVDWPFTEAKPSSTNSEAGLERWLVTLIERKMLTSAADADQPRGTIHAPTETLNTDLLAARRVIRWRTLLDLGWSAAVSSHWLKRRSLADIAGAVGGLRRQHDTQVAPAADMLRASVASYTRLRPFVLTTHDKCLHDSLTLVHFLARRGLYPNWVVGVRTRPFGAHSWVQEGSLVLNDLHETVRAFKPILVV